MAAYHPRAKANREYDVTQRANMPSLNNSIIRDDMHLGAGAHIGVLVIPTALALAQRDNWTGAQLLKGIVGGYEMAVALGEAVRHGGHVNPHFRPSGIVGAFGAAGVGVAGAAIAIINSDDDQGVETTSTTTTAIAASALGFGANFAAGLNEWPWAGGTEINTHMGMSSRSGITSFDLARSGMYSSSTALEGKDGLFVAYGCGGTGTGTSPSSSSSEKFFQEWLATSPCGAGILGSRFKPLAGCNMIQTPMAVALRLHEAIREAIGEGATGAIQLLEEIEQILIVTTTPARDYPGCDSAGPFSKVQQTKMSLQYGVAAALLFGRVDEFTYSQYDDADLQRLIGKCVIETDPSYDRELASAKKQPCRIEIRIKGAGPKTPATHREAFLDDVPWLQGRAVEDRFRTEAEPFWGRQTVSDILDFCHRLEDMQDCTELFRLLSHSLTR